MKLLLPLPIIERLKRELRGRSREIGGVLVGEHVENETFRIVDISVQLSGGTAAHFVRDPVLHKAFLDDFFRRTGQDYQRFNYIGEWHSHPMFTPLPSGEDFTTMLELIRDPAVGVNFAVLIIARLGLWSGMQLSATIFRNGYAPEPAEVAIEGDDTVTRLTILQRILRFFH
jgi:integrative and conjugative element protein (TIGR02256 family)